MVETMLKAEFMAEPKAKAGAKTVAIADAMAKAVGLATLQQVL